MSRWLDIHQVLFWHVYGRGRGPYTHKERTRLISSHLLMEQAWSIKNLLHSFQGVFFSCVTHRVVLRRQGSTILPAHVQSPILQCWISFILTDYGASHKTNFKNIDLANSKYCGRILLLLGLG